jgi:adenine-specific DNA-methyltransferase
VADDGSIVRVSRMASSLEYAEPIRDEHELAGVCAALGAGDVAGWTAGEAALAASARPIERHRLEGIRAAMQEGLDPLGDAFCALRPAAQRRPMGATYTPLAIVDAMVAWARTAVSPGRVIDPGTGSGRFLVAAGRAFPHARLVGVEMDPLAASMARASLAAAGLAGRSSVIVGDYREVALDHEAGPALFIGNPPYVRHHDIEPRWKRWLSETASAHGLRASRLAGLHLHFLLATLVHARAGDAGTFITAAEWLDVNYGQLARALASGPLGGLRIDIIEPAAQAFADAQATAAITCFRVGARPASLQLRRVGAIGDLAPLRGGHRVSRQRLAASTRWTPLSRGAERRAPVNTLIALGELCRVHRGQVTGANHVWIAAGATPGLPASVLFPAVTRARELFAAGPALVEDAGLRRVIDLPSDLDCLSAAEREAVERFLAWARERGGHTSYIARHRSPWWSVRLREPAPILATYMARRPPAFVRNRVRARFLNIAHGLYPRAPMSDECLDALAAYLSSSVRLVEGRTYAGGLTKFEPREMERLLVPDLDALARRAAARRAA